MKGIFTRLAAVFLAAALVTPAAQAAGTEADPIQVGLAYGSGALVNANLENNTGYGAGYRLGYFDRDLDFVELGRTGSKETRITVVKAQNTWVNGLLLCQFRQWRRGDRKLSPPGGDLRLL